MDISLQLWKRRLIHLFYYRVYLQMLEPYLKIIQITFRHWYRHRSPPRIFYLHHRRLPNKTDKNSGFLLIHFLNRQIYGWSVKGLHTQVLQQRPAQQPRRPLPRISPLSVNAGNIRVVQNPHTLILLPDEKHSPTQRTVTPVRSHVANKLHPP